MGIHSISLGRAYDDSNDTSLLFIPQPPEGATVPSVDGVIDDLAAEQDSLESVLSGLTKEQWSAPSAAAGWSVADVVLHLAQTEEAVVAAVGAETAVAGAGTPAMWRREGASVDDAAEAAVQAERASGASVFARWQAARRSSVEALRAADPHERVPWVASTLTPPALATTRLAEHWAHSLDITDALQLSHPDTDRIRHIAWLGHRTLPYSFQVAGQEPHEIYCELTGPSGATWAYGPDSAESTIRGSAAEFCRVGAQRLSPEQTSLRCEGPYAAAALRVLRNYAA
jgi:uncharacterized protein (TIGR03084 family)